MVNHNTKSSFRPLPHSSGETTLPLARGSRNPLSSCSFVAGSSSCRKGGSIHLPHTIDHYSHERRHYPRYDGISRDYGYYEPWYRRTWNPWYWFKEPVNTQTIVIDKHDEQDKFQQFQRVIQTPVDDNRNKASKEDMYKIAIGSGLIMFILFAVIVALLMRRKNIRE
jgi:hypothetical protein